MEDRGYKNTRLRPRKFNKMWIFQSRWMVGNLKIKMDLMKYLSNIFLSNLKIV